MSNTRWTPCSITVQDTSTWIVCDTEHDSTGGVVGGFRTAAVTSVPSTTISSLATEGSSSEVTPTSELTSLDNPLPHGTATSTSTSTTSPMGIAVKPPLADSPASTAVPTSNARGKKLSQVTSVGPSPDTASSPSSPEPTRSNPGDLVPVGRSIRPMTSIASQSAGAGGAEETIVAPSRIDTSSGTTIGLPSTTTRQASAAAGSQHRANVAPIIGAASGAVALSLLALALLYRRYRHRASRRGISRFTTQNQNPEAGDDDTRTLTDVASPSTKTMMHQLELPPSGAQRPTSQPGSAPLHDVSVLDIHPHALESVIGQAPTTNPESLPRVSRLFLHIPEDAAKPFVSARSSRRSARFPAFRLRHEPTQSPEAIPTRAIMSPNMDRITPVQSDEDQDSNDSGTVVDEQVVYEVDGGVRLAGGPPGRMGSVYDVRQLRGRAVTLPPPYQEY